jgi:hypothetical protein
MGREGESENARIEADGGKTDMEERRTRIAGEMSSVRDCPTEHRPFGLRLRGG